MTYFTAQEQIALKSKAIKEDRREIRESLSVMFISSVHDYDQNYDHDEEDDNGNGDGAGGLVTLVLVIPLNVAVHPRNVG